MSSSLLHAPANQPPATALRHAQQAPAVLQSSSGAANPSTLQSLLGAPETAELWTKLENLFLACLRTGDGVAARQCLARLATRFGDDNERIMALEGLLKEADAEDDAALQTVLKGYDQILEASPTNVPVAKRRAALLRSMGKASDAITALVALLDFSPTDAEAWSELSDLYFSQGLYSQSAFALEEVLVLQPNAWNIHARLGEILLVAARAAAQPEATKQLAEAFKRFCRSIELCDDYLRGYYGLKLCTKQLLAAEPSKPSKQSEPEGFSVPEVAKIQKLDAVATEKLAEIVRRNTAQEPGWKGYDAAEIAAARELLAKDSNSTVR